MTPEEFFQPCVIPSPDSVVAVGGQVSLPYLVYAYRNGIYPMCDDRYETEWHCPDPRFVVVPSLVKVSKTMRQLLRRAPFRVTVNHAFRSVLHECATVPRREALGTWLTPQLQAVLYEMHEAGLAHSVEVWQGEELVGGLYGIYFGNLFCGESMFAKVSNASKTGFITFAHFLEKRGCQVIDCQMYTPHLHSLGGIAVDGDAFVLFAKRQPLTMLFPDAPMQQITLV